MGHSYFFQWRVEHVLHACRGAFENFGIMCNYIIHCFVFGFGIHQQLICVLYVGVRTKNGGDLRIIIQRFQLGVNLFGRSSVRLQTNDFIWF